MRKTLADSGYLVRRACLGLGAVSLLAMTGCQSTYNGQTLPSPFYLRDDVQYPTPGPEFKLAKEAAAQKAYREDQAAQNGPDAVPPPPVPGPPVGAPPMPPPPGPAARGNGNNAYSSTY